MQLSVTVALEPGAVVVSVAGQLDIATTPRLRERLLEVLHEGGVRVIVDVRGVTFLDSTGLSCLVAAAKRFRFAGGSLELVADTDPVLRLLRMTGLHRVLPPHPSVDAAMNVIAEATTS